MIHTIITRNLTIKAICQGIYCEIAFPIKKHFSKIRLTVIIPAKIDM
ncbi:hypothetical protein HAP32_02551 [Serratia fonticola]|nr:hypothetical protein HAP32_02551 [Serratia fonticola]